MREWTIRRVSKTRVQKCTVGSNPTPSAIKKGHQYPMAFYFNPLPYAILRVDL
jgi:hypothetical protein